MTGRTARERASPSGPKPSSLFLGQPLHYRFWLALGKFFIIAFMPSIDLRSASAASLGLTTDVPVSLLSPQPGMTQALAAMTVKRKTPGRRTVPLELMDASTCDMKLGQTHCSTQMISYGCTSVSCEDEMHIHKIFPPRAAATLPNGWDDQQRHLIVKLAYGCGYYCP